MPIYEYHCSGCGIKYEKIVFSSSGNQAPACPNCGSQNVEKLISVPGGMTGAAASPASSCATAKVGGCTSGFS